VFDPEESATSQHSGRQCRFLSNARPPGHVEFMGCPKPTQPPIITRVQFKAGKYPYKKSLDPPVPVARTQAVNNITSPLSSAIPAYLHRKPQEGIPENSRKVSKSFLQFIVMDSGISRHSSDFQAESSRRESTASSTATANSAHDGLKHSQDAFLANFPEPKGDVDIGEALERTPLRWSLSGQMEANQRKKLKSDANTIASAESKLAAFEKTKRDLLASFESLQFI
jgi:hypothetical protein